MNRAIPERFFAIPRHAGQTATSGAQGVSSWDEYNFKYPEDEYGKEFGPNARVWRLCNDENERFDAEMIQGWRDTADVLLVFVGIYSSYYLH
jgi:hypothetical protein